MKLKEQTIQKIHELKPGTLAKVYDLIIELKRTEQPEKNKMIRSDYIKVREVLKHCRGSLSEDIINGREERV